MVLALLPWLKTFSLDWNITLKQVEYIIIRAESEMTLYSCINQLTCGGGESIRSERKDYA